MLQISSVVSSLMIVSIIFLIKWKENIDSTNKELDKECDAIRKTINSIIIEIEKKNELKKNNDFQ